MDGRKWDALLEMQVEQGWWHTGLAEAYIKIFKTHVPPPKKILEMGLGEGPPENRMLKEAGYEVTGITIRPHEVVEGITLMDMHDLRFPPNTFDAIYSTQTMEHGYAPYLVLLECWTVLRDGGTLFAVMPCPDEHLVETHPTMLTCLQWSTLMSHAGFNVKYGQDVGFVVNCRCLWSDGSKSADMRHRERCLVIVAEKKPPESTYTRTVLGKLKKIHEEYGCLNGSTS